LISPFWFFTATTIIVFFFDVSSEILLPDDPASGKNAGYSGGRCCLFAGEKIKLDIVFFFATFCLMIKI